MTPKVVPSDIHIDEQLVKLLLLEQFNLSIKSISVLGEGWDNKVFLVNNHLGFRFPRRKESISLIKNEINLLPALSKKVSVKMPSPLFIGQASKLFSRPFYGYEIIKGHVGSNVTLNPQQYDIFAHDLALFLKELHGIKPQNLGINYADFAVGFDRNNFKVTNKKFLDRKKSLEQHYDFLPFDNKILEICADASHIDPKPMPPVLVHGDLYNRHVIFNDELKFSGVIDWGDASITDAMADLGILYQFIPKAHHDIFFSVYGPVDEDRRRYARYIGLYFAIAMLWFGHDRRDKDLMRTSLWTLQEI